MSKQVVRQRSLLLGPAHKHGDGGSDTLIDVNDKHFFLVAKKNGAAAAGGDHRANLHFDNGFTHIASLARRLYASRSEFAHSLHRSQILETSTSTRHLGRFRRFSMDTLRSFLPTCSVRPKY